MTKRGMTGEGTGARLKTDAGFILDSRVSPSLEDKNLWEPPEVDARE